MSECSAEFFCIDHKFVPEGMAADEAPDAFDELVREIIPTAMGKSSVRLIHCWIMGLACLGRVFDVLGVAICHG